MNPTISWITPPNLVTSLRLLLVPVLTLLAWHRTLIPFAILFPLGVATDESGRCRGDAVPDVDPVE